MSVAARGRRNMVSAVNKLPGSGKYICYLMTALQNRGVGEYMLLLKHRVGPVICAYTSSLRCLYTAY